MSEIIEKNLNLLVSIVFPISIDDVDDGEENRYFAQAMGTIGCSEWGKTEQEAVDALHQAIVAKLYDKHHIQMLDRITGTPPTAEEMMHMVESMLFDNCAHGTINQDTLDDARAMLLRAVGPQSHSWNELGLKEPNGK